MLRHPSLPNVPQYDQYLLPYAEIGASFQQYPFWSIVVGGLFFCFRFEFGRTQNIVSR